MQSSNLYRIVLFFFFFKINATVPIVAFTVGFRPQSWLLIGVDTVELFISLADQHMCLLTFRNK